MNKITTLITNEIGLEPDSIGIKSLDYTIVSTMKKRKFDSIDNYYSELLINKNELDFLIEEIIVPETWFFRDKETFKFLKQWVIDNRIITNNDKNLKILSAPSATGEEATSIAITMLEAGLQLTRFNIHAVDISSIVLNKAKKGVFKHTSFRDNQLFNIAKYFTINDDNNFVLNKNILSKISFFKQNLINTDPLISNNKYDIIFCKNLLIYLTNEARALLLNNFFKLLNDNGLLFVGHTELSLVQQFGFVSLNVSKAFVLSKSPNYIDNKVSNNMSYLSENLINSKYDYNNKKITTSKELDNNLYSKFKENYKKNDVDILKREKIEDIKKIYENLKKNQSNIHFDNYNSINTNIIHTKNELEAETNIANKNEFNINDILQLANQGLLDNAEQNCINYLKQYPTDAEAFYVMGIIYLAKNSNDSAMNYFNKAIYLNPEHYESLMNLSLLNEQLGSIDKAELLKQRAKKIYNKNLVNQ